MIQSTGALMMKRLGSTIGLACVASFLSYFMVSRTIASDAVPSSAAQAHVEIKKMKLKELLQRLEAANPWTIERVSEALGAKLKLADIQYYKPNIVNHSASRLDYGEGLTIADVILQLDVKKDNKMYKITLNLDENSKCFTRDNIKKIYPDMDLNKFFSDGVSHSEGIIEPLGGWIYPIGRPWGGLLFHFEHERPHCLRSIYLEPPKSKYDGLSINERKVKLEEVLQRLEAVHPWTVEKVSKALDVNLKRQPSKKEVSVFESSRVLYEEDFFVLDMNLRFDAKTNKPLWLILEADTTLGTCFQFERVKKMYPDIELSPIGAPPRSMEMSKSITYFYTKRPWGRLSFGFKKVNPEKPNCLCDIVLAPDK